MTNTKRRRLLRARVVLLVCLVATLLISAAIIVSSSHRPATLLALPTAHSSTAVDHRHRRQLSTLRSIVQKFRDPKSTEEKTPRFYKYAYIIVNYNKSGHALSDVLVKHINSNLLQFGGRGLAKNYVQPDGHFNSRTKCTEISFAPGTITVIGEPQFLCSVEHLRDILMSHPDPKQPKWGVKIIHLVRNPFTMAVSNYHYHLQDPSPDPSFANTKNPCSGLTQDTVGSTRTTLKDLAVPLLSRPKMKIRVNGQAPKLHGIMKREDFQHIADDCSLLYQTKPGMENATFYDHLRMLDRTEGLRLATADKMNTIVLMAVNLLMFKRVRDLVKASSRNHINGDMEVKTLLVDDYIHQPSSSMYRLYDFIFQDLIDEEVKVTRSQTYEQSYLRERESHHQMNKHITYGKFEDTAELTEYLRNDSVFGPVLTRIEGLLDEILFEESVATENVLARMFRSSN
ncbi:hypothetical protein ACHAWC_004192 [Mediolabrus comicus]